MITRRRFTGLHGLDRRARLRRRNRARRRSLPVIRLGNAAGIIDPQLTFLTMGQHPQAQVLRGGRMRMDILNMSGAGQTLQAIATSNCRDLGGLAARVPQRVRQEPDDRRHVPVLLAAPAALVGGGEAGQPDQVARRAQGQEDRHPQPGRHRLFRRARHVQGDRHRSRQATSNGWRWAKAGRPARRFIRPRRRHGVLGLGASRASRSPASRCAICPTTPGMQQLFGNAYGVRRSDLAKNRDLYVRFFRAMAKSTVFAYANIDLAIRLHWEIYPESKPKGKSDQEAFAEARKIVDSRKDKWLPADVADRQAVRRHEQGGMGGAGEVRRPRRPGEGRRPRRSPTSCSTRSTNSTARRSRTRRGG